MSVTAWPSVTVIVPFYRNCSMLAAQLQNWDAFPPEFRFIVVDDGSPEPALPIVREHASGELQRRLQLYRVGVDIAWNICGARNLGAKQADTDWIIQHDIDHTMPASAAKGLVDAKVKPGNWYRFPRYRVGRADETRRKDALDPSVEFGPVKPHCDSYLCERSLYWRVGGMDEDYAGCLGGGSPFLKQMEEAAPVKVLSEPICLHVHTRSSVADASDFSLSRDTSEYSRRRRDKEARGDTRAKDSLRFPWSRVL